MAVTVTSSIGNSHSLFSSTSLATGESTSNSTLEVAATISLISADASQGADGEAALLIAADATAIGEDTLALADIDGLVSVSEFGSTVTADVVLVAAATGQDYVGPIYTSTAADITASSADFMFAFALTTTATSSTDGFTASLSTTQASVVAVGGAGLNGGGQSGDAGPVVPVTVGTSLPAVTTDSGSMGDYGIVAIEGNLAWAEIQVDALGPDGLVDVAADVLTLEDQLSTISAQIIVLVG